MVRSAIWQLQEIRPGMILRVLPGERLPVDADVVEGQSSVDCSHVTGESEPQFAKEGERLQAGALNLVSPIDVRAVSDAEKSFLGEMQRMMREAENGRSQYVRIADRMARIYAPAVHLLALVTFIGWMIVTSGDWYSSIYTAIAVLIITCPCALGLAVPVAHVIGAKRLMEEGILMRDGTALERIAEVDFAVFDKTGTLTQGTSARFQSTVPSKAQSSIISRLAQNSSHPVAAAVAVLVQEEPGRGVDAIAEHPGKGVEGIWKGKRVRLGKPEWISEIADHTVKTGTEASVSFVVEGENPIGFETSEQLRDDAAGAIASLCSSGVDVSVVSGDRAQKVEALAKKIGARNYQAERSPEDKISYVEELKTSGNKVLMVGDGINDAPALAAGNVSMAPASASDAGRLASDFIFTRPSLHAVPAALSIARTTGMIVRQNFALAIAYNCIAVPLAMAGYVTPLFAAIAMSASSIAVVGNSLRINFKRHQNAVLPVEPGMSGTREGIIA